MLRKKIIFWIFCLIAATFYAIEPISHYAALLALVMGIMLSSTNKFYKPTQLNKYRKLILNTSIIFFGFSLNINEVIAIGSKGIVISLISLVITISIGYLLIKLTKIDQKTGELTTYGTAICGGSAISATSAIINPNNHQLAVSTAIVFILNGFALILFPAIGHLLNMSQEQFGVFAALSIHDVSSVVGAASVYGETSLKLATVLKLTRTLWIIPIVLILNTKYQVTGSKLPIPLFILGFLLASVLTTIINSPIIVSLNVIGKYLLPVALFMVGYAIKINDIKELGKKGFVFGVLLWISSIITGLVLAFMW